MGKVGKCRHCGSDLNYHRHYFLSVDDEAYCTDTCYADHLIDLGIIKVDNGGNLIHDGNTYEDLVDLSEELGTWVAPWKKWRE